MICRLALTGQGKYRDQQEATSEMSTASGLCVNCKKKTCLKGLAKGNRKV